VKNTHGLDCDYFGKILRRIERDLSFTRPSEMANMLEDLQSVAEDQMRDEPLPHFRNKVPK